MKNLNNRTVAEKEILKIKTYFVLKWRISAIDILDAPIQ